MGALLLHKRNQSHKSSALDGEGDFFLGLDGETGVVAWNVAAPLGDKFSHEPEILEVGEFENFISVLIFSVLVGCHKRVNVRRSRARK